MEISTKTEQYDRNNRAHYFAPAFDQLFKGPEGISPKFLKSWARAEVEKRLRNYYNTQLKEEYKAIRAAQGKIVDEHNTAINKVIEAFRGPQLTTSTRDKALRAAVEKKTTAWNAEQAKLNELKDKIAKQRLTIEQDVEGEIADEVKKYYPLINTMTKIAHVKTIFVDESNKAKLEHRIQMYDYLLENGLLHGFSLKLPDSSKYLLDDLKKLMASDEAKIATTVRNQRVRSLTSLKEHVERVTKLIERVEEPLEKQQLEKILPHLEKSLATLSSVMDNEKRSSTVLEQIGALTDQISYKLQEIHKKPPGDTRVYTRQSKYFGKRLVDCPIEYVRWIAEGGNLPVEAVYLQGTATLKDGRKVAVLLQYESSIASKPEKILIKNKHGNLEKIERTEVTGITKKAGKKPQLAKVEQATYKPDSYIVDKAKAYLETAEGKMRAAARERVEELRDEPDMGQHPHQGDKVVSDDVRRRGGYGGDQFLYPEDVYEKSRESHVAFAEQRRGTKAELEAEDREGFGDTASRALRLIRLIDRLPLAQQHEVLRSASKYKSSAGLLDRMSREQTERFLRTAPHLLLSHEVAVLLDRRPGGVTEGEHATGMVGLSIVQQREATLNQLRRRFDPEWKSHSASWYNPTEEHKEHLTSGQSGIYAAAMELWERIDELQPDESLVNVAAILKDMKRLLIAPADLGVDELETTGRTWHDQLEDHLTEKLRSSRLDKMVVAHEGSFAEAIESGTVKEMREAHRLVRDLKNATEPEVVAEGGEAPPLEYFSSAELSRNYDPQRDIPSTAPPEPETMEPGTGPKQPYQQIVSPMIPEKDLRHVKE